MTIDKIYPGVYEFYFGEREKFEPSSFLLEKTKSEKLNSLSDCKLPFEKNEIGSVTSARGSLLIIPYSSGEEIYGFGLQNGQVNQAGQKRILKTNADARGNTGNSHAAIPFYVSTKGYGIVIDTARYTTFYVASSKPHKKSDTNTGMNDTIKTKIEELYASKAYDGVITAETNGTCGMHGYIFTGENVSDVCRRYVLFSGGGAMPPLWGLGVWYRACGQFTEKEVLETAEKFRREEMPVTVLGLEPGWHSHAYSCTYKFDEKRFGDYKNTLKKLQSMDYNVNLWEHAFIHPSSDIYDKMEPYAADYDVFGGMVPDLSIKEARDIYAGYHDEYLLEEGVAGFKCDECDNSDFTGGWSFPDHTSFPSGMDGEQMHSNLPMYYQRSLYEIYKNRNLRTWGEVRAQHDYAAPYPFLLYSDWYEHNDYISMVLNMGFSGILYSPEIRTAENKADLYRRMLTGIFSPKLEMNIWFMPLPMWENYNHDGNWKREILPDAKTLRDDCRSFMNLRTSLSLYLYTSFYKYHTEGINPVRALQMDYPECRGRENSGYVNGLSFGDDIIAYPLTAAQREVKIFLPNGMWYCFYSKQKYEGGSEYVLTYEVDKIPVFVREGTIIPFIHNITGFVADSNLIIKPEAYGENSSCFIYTDDFKTFDFEKGKFKTYELKYKNGTIEIDKKGDDDIGDLIFI